ncbi:ribosomal RNA small subunit methyltransferase B [Caldalkalibacillus thermarum]|uniref:16S rRNA (cytosine(967)-C(5))-methyltransferase RsmB n=1 Tax=Caldalkalibacillus thermarum TaxID=296745 RepID=UPI001665C8EE|nr:16S rRNA (cytosine(967)-C(5))-methyltransferase RsmB [Caldalkalibacillus thermarum]GGK14178.1 ribosomal RNA small subunit methyltransferase B [Caldalkalibacillus thermarum]
MANPRALALDVLIKVEEQKAYSHLVLNQVLNKHRQLDLRDRHLLTELVYGTIQHQRLLDFYLEPYLKQGMAKLDVWVKQLLRLSAYQLFFLTRIPSYAVVNEAVKLAKKRGHRGIQGLINGVLRNLLREPKRSLDTICDPVERIAVETSHPTWLVARWTEQFGLKTAQEICRANNERPVLTVRVNPLKASKQEVMDHLRALGYHVSETAVAQQGLRVENPAKLMESSLFKQGYFTIQSESSMLVAPLLRPEPGMKVLDLCAAPGGKTTHLAELMDNRGHVVANDVHAHKLKLIKKAAKRLGITIINVTAYDGTTVSPGQLGHFERILVDAPCSGFGVIKHKPDLKWHKRPEDIKQIAELQLQLLTRAAQLLIPGGQLVYSTCTIDREENESVITRFLEDHPDFEVGEIRQIFPQDFGSDGFFMAKLNKA